MANKHDISKTSEKKEICKMLYQFQKQMVKEAISEHEKKITDEIKSCPDKTSKLWDT